MVHQTINTKISKAARASTRNNHMRIFSRHTSTLHRLSWLLPCIVGTLLAACSSAPPWPQATQGSGSISEIDVESPVAGEPIAQARSLWTPVAWSDLPGWTHDDLSQAWPAWVRSCNRPAPAWTQACRDIRQLAAADVQTQRTWAVRTLQPYRVSTPQGQTQGLLTAYYEPRLQAMRQATGEYSVPLYAPPQGLRSGRLWYSRQEIDTLPQAQRALRPLMYLRDPVDAMVLHIQGSGLLEVTEPDGRVRNVRLAFAGTNEHPYRSVGRWLLDRKLTRDASWPGIKAWIAQNPQRTQELLWSNPRVVFFKEQSLPEGVEPPGPTGAQGVALTAGRSIAVDRQSLPYGTPVWLVTEGPTASLQKLVLAQDTGAAIVGAVRADYFVGSGTEAGELAGRLKQNLKLWVLWPRSSDAR